MNKKEIEPVLPTSSIYILTKTKLTTKKTNLNQLGISPFCLFRCKVTIFYQSCKHYANFLPFAPPARPAFFARLSRLCLICPACLCSVCGGSAAALRRPCPPNRFFSALRAYVRVIYNNVCLLLFLLFLFCCVKKRLF